MEKVYQYIWQHRLWDSSEARLCDGRRLEVLDPGIGNNDSGPDFFNAKIRIEGQEWAGNVELHVLASDWRRHGHDSDPAYDSIILHVVGVDDARIRRNDGSEVPQLCMALSPELIKSFAVLTEGGGDIRCEHGLAGLADAEKRDWLDALLFERLRMKSERIAGIERQGGADREQACFATVARALGFGLNAEPFEILARSIPLRVLHHHSDNLFQIESLLFGQAGMLDPSINIFDEYYQSLCREYYFLMRKYGLHPIPAHIWKYARTRPANFPHRRIAMLARYCLDGFRMYRDILEAEGDEERLTELFRCTLDGYWREHIGFGALDSCRAPVRMGIQSVRLMLINAVAPIYFGHALATGLYYMEECAVELLERLPAESNSIVRRWASAGIGAKNAADSQALLQLRREYCDRRRCLYCRFGHRILRHSK